MLTCDYTAAARGTGCETDGSSVSLKTVNSDLCDMMIWGASSGDVVDWYWYWNTETLKWNLCKT